MFNEGWIKIHRKIIGSSVWLKGPIVTQVWIWCLLKANHKPCKVPFKQGDIELQSGEFITSRKTATKEMRLTSQSYRSAILYLKSTNRITIKSTSRYTIIRIEKYNDYQSQDDKLTIKLTNEITNDQPTTNQPLTTDKKLRSKECKEDKENILCAKAHEPASNKQKPSKETDPDLSLVIKYIYDSRLRKTGNKYIISGKLAKNLKNLCRVHTHTAVCAAWSVFINDKLDLKDREFWCKGYSPDSFTNHQCFSICQSAPSYKDFVKRHEVETFGYKPMEVKCDVKSFGG